MAEREEKFLVGLFNPNPVPFSLEILKLLYILPVNFLCFDTVSLHLQHFKLPIMAPYYMYLCIALRSYAFEIYAFWYTLT